ncbi:hypothetical protein [Myxococcus virescens]|uniref:Uncharacterized protein n=1 Tax=Myxococcus virescens TaxID=83456 RepID=A0A511HNL8_9BACT|nr:hypothetical protein [Myxococcus virescens]GEL75180.1 hypothetical protein MVI01_69640 [Myxococcus virescens]SDD64624.1 hypothetical protein SAMN04488504_102105 [Myxococcus virescens]
MSTCTTPRARLLAVTVPQPYAYSVAVRACPVVNLAEVPPGALGSYVAVCAGEYDEGIAHWMDVHGGIRPFASEDIHTGTVLAVARVAAVSQWPDVPRESRWYVGPVGLWLADVIRLPELVSVEPGPAAQCWELPEDVRAAVRAGYATVQAEDKARWTDFNARAARAQSRPPAPTLKDKLLRLCNCRRAMTPCPTCKSFRCLNPDCGPHACHQEARP